MTAALALLVAAQVSTSTAVHAPPPAPVDVVSRWTVTLTGFVEADAIFDSTQSFGDFAGNAVIAHPGSYAAEHRRLTFGARHSRLGFRVAAPPFEGLRASALIEVDLLGTQPPGTSEAAVFASPLLRLRHASLKLETPIVELLAGQSWALFGWQPLFHPASVQIQGLPGEVFNRAPQLRLSKTLRDGDLQLDLALAAVRPPQRDAAVPDGQAGVKLAWHGWRGTRTIGAVLKQVDPLALGLSGVLRRFSVPELAATPKRAQNAAGWGLSIDALVPLLPATPEVKGNALTLTASFAKGEGTADLYTGLTGGAALPTMAGTASWAPGIDAGLVLLDGAGRLVPVEWRSFLAGLQYYFPPGGDVWVAAAFSWLSSSNLAPALTATAPGRLFTTSWFADLSLFVDVTPAVRCGLEGAWFRQALADGADATSWRGQLSLLYLL